MKIDIVKFTQIMLLLLFATISNLGISQIKNREYKLSFHPDIAKNNINITTTFHNISNNCKTQVSGVLLNTYIFQFEINKKVKDLYYKNQDTIIYLFSPKENKNKHNVNRAVLNIGFIGADSSFCNGLVRYKFDIKHKIVVGVENYFKGFVINYIKNNRLLKDTLNYSLLMIPLINDNDKPFNIAIRKLISDSNQKVQSREIFFIWNKQALPELPSIFKDIKYKEISLYEFPMLKSKIISEKRANHNSSIKNENTDQKHELLSPHSELDSPKYDTNLLTINFDGYCPDDITINYVVFSEDGTNLTGSNSVVTKNRTIQIEKYSLLDLGYKNKNLIIELSIGEDGYYFKDRKIGDKVNIDNTSTVIEFSLADSVKKVFISNIPDYYLIYIDANSFSDKIHLAKTLKSKFDMIQKTHASFFIYFANGTHPIYSFTKDGYMNILSRLITQETTIGIMSNDWYKIGKEVDISYLKELSEHGNVHIEMYLSKNIYELRKEDIPIYIVDNIGDAFWGVKIISDYKIKNRIKRSEDLNMNEIIFQKL